MVYQGNIDMSAHEYLPLPAPARYSRGGNPVYLPVINSAPSARELPRFHLLQPDQNPRERTPKLTSQMVLNDTIQPQSLIMVPLNSVRQLLLRELSEMVELSLHRTNPRVLEEEPLDALVPLVGVLEAELVALVVVLG
jgi:hypothetical protein